MRVLYIIDSLITAGAETSLAHLAPALTDRGLDLQVAFLRDKWDLADQLTAAGAAIHPVALGESRYRQFRALRSLVRELQPALVHTTLWESDVLGRCAAYSLRIPSVTTFASSSYSPEHYQNPSVSRTKLRGAQVVDAATCRLATRFHAVAAHVADEVAGRLRVDRNRIDVIPRARSRDHLGEPSPERRARARGGLELSDSTPLILAVGRHEHEKGLDQLVEAIAVAREQVPELVVVVAGRSSRATPELETLIHDHQLDRTIRLLGRRDDVPDLMVAADVVAIPSRVEGFPGVALEAMALERPVVGFDIPPLREALAETAFGLVPAGRTDLLAEALVRAVTSDTAQSGSAARDRFDARFTPAVVADQMLAFYRHALGPGG